MLLNKCMRYFEGRWILEVSNFITDYYPYFQWVGVAWGLPGGSAVKSLPAMQEWSKSCSAVSNSLWPHGLYSPWNSPGQNTGVGNLSLLQGIFPTQGSNPGLLHCRQILYQLSHKGRPHAIQETWVQFLNWEDPLEEGMATHSSILAWRTPWTEEPGRL